MGSCNGLVHAIDAGTGRARWTYNALQDGGKRAEFHGTPVSTDDLVIFGSDDRTAGGVGHVYAFEQATGTIRWKYRAGAGVMTDIVREGDSLYAVTLQDELISLDVASGRPRWTFSSGWINERLTNVMATPALSDGRVLFGGRNGVVYAIEATSGRLIWKRDFGSPVVTPLRVSHGAVYFGTIDERIHRLVLGSAAEHAELALEGVPFGPPTVLGDSLLLLVYDKPEEGSLKAFDFALKSVRWSREAPGGWSSARPVVWRGSALTAARRGNFQPSRPTARNNGRTSSAAPSAVLE